jgi:DNA invertase Pin-like site-specific DNA recombinase
MMAAPSADDFTPRMFAAVNAMLLDVLAAVARKDYEDRRRRQAQGIEKAKAAGKFRGRPEDTDRNNGIAAMLRKGVSWNDIQDATDCSRATIAKIAARVKAAA